LEIAIVKQLFFPSLFAKLLRVKCNLKHMATELLDKERVRRLLYSNPIENARMIYSTFFGGRDFVIYVDNLTRPKGVMTISLRRPNLVSMYCRSEKAAKDLLNSLESGKKYHFHSIPQEIVPLIQERFHPESRKHCYLFSLAKKDFKDEQRHEVRPLSTRDAETVSAYWETNDALDYIRWRLKDGLSAGIFLNGELVAWDATHFETDVVVMLGFLHVKEKYRGFGYAKSVTSAMCKAVFDKGKMPVCYVYTDNLPSIKLTEEIGFKRVAEHYWMDGVKK